MRKNRLDFQKKNIIKLSRRKRTTNSFVVGNTNETYSLKINCGKSTINHSLESSIPDEKVQTTIVNKEQYNEKGNTHTNYMNNTTYIHRT